MPIYLDFPTVGLGNNLFSLAAGMQLAANEDTELLILTNQTKGFSSKVLNIESLYAINQVIQYLGIQEVNVDESKAIRKAFQEQRLDGVIESCPYCFCDFGNRQGNSRYIRGYFQNPEYFRGVFDLVLSAVKNLTTGIEMHFNHSIQIRRGDFEKPRNRKKIGLLSPRYFKQILQLFPKNEPINVHSDGNFEEILRTINMDIALVWVEPQTSILNSLRSLANSELMIISNSTFAWWAAALGEFLGITKVVISPSIWNRESGCSSCLVNSTWINVDSLWV